MSTIDIGDYMLLTDTQVKRYLRIPKETEEALLKNEQEIVHDDEFGLSCPVHRSPTMFEPRGQP